MSSLHDIFTPSKATRIRQLKLLIDLHRRQIGNCPTCVHYIPTPPGTPGWLDDRGSCGKNCQIFDIKMTSCTKIDCPVYSENKQTLKRLEARLKELEEEA